MKIVINVEAFDPNKGYLEPHLAEELARMGHKVFVFTFSHQRKTRRYKIVSLSNIISINGYHVPSFGSIRNIFQFLVTERPDIIHCQPLDSPLSLFFVFWSNIFRYGVVGTVISQLNVIFSPWNTIKKILFSISKIVISSYAARKSSVIFAKSHTLAKIISRSYAIPLNKFHIIPLGTDPELFKFNSDARKILRNRLGLSEKDVVVLYSGRIDPTKGIDVLIRALSSIVDENNKVKLLIIGKGKSSYVEHLKKLAFDFKVSNNIIFHPWVQRNKLSDFYSSSDIAVWPGLSSISIVDAASAGLPLIIADTPTEIFGVDNKNGFTFKIGNVAELRSHLITLINNEELRKEMGLRSRYLVERRLNWKFIANQYHDTYRKVLGL